MSDELNQPVSDSAAVPAEIYTDFYRVERDLAREQITAAWQIQVEAIQEQLERGWRDHVARALDERFDALRAAADQEIERRVAARLSLEAERARASSARHTCEVLNQTARRLAGAEDIPAWSAALLDGASAFCQRCWLFGHLSGKLELQGERSPAGPPPAGESAPALSVEISAAPAFQSVLDSLDTVIAIASPGELSEPIASLVVSSSPEGGERRVWLIPIATGQSERQNRLSAILLADGAAGTLDAPPDANALELLAAFAGSTLDARQAAQRAAVAPSPAGLLSIAAPEVAKHSAAAPDWNSLAKEDQEIHARAQRFARVRVAEMRLYQAEAVRNGREQARLYMALRGEMDRSRAQFKHEYMHSPTMVDYFHMEVLRTLANDDASLLGPEYPGPLV
jgi:hypothetical protein